MTSAGFDNTAVIGTYAAKNCFWLYTFNVRGPGGHQMYRCVGFCPDGCVV